MVSSEGDALRREAQALDELTALQRDPAYYGWGLPRGDGRLVLVIPGLFGNDLYLQPLRGWLRQLGYAPLFSTLTLNAGCPNRLREQVEVPLRWALQRRPGPVVLIGHSRGGALAWALASRLQEAVSHLVLLGSPAAAVVQLMHRPPAERSTLAIGGASFVADSGARALRSLDPSCAYPACDCAYPADLRRPLSPILRVLSIYSRDDPIVAPAACQAPGARNVEVSGTHTGLVYNRAVYPELARFLAAP